MLMIMPQLQEYVTAELSKEACIFKEKRKLKEMNNKPYALVHFVEAEKMEKLGSLSVLRKGHSQLLQSSILLVDVVMVSKTCACIWSMLLFSGNLIN